MPSQQTPLGLQSRIQDLERRLESNEFVVRRAENLATLVEGQRRQLNLMAGAIERYLPTSYPRIGGLAFAGHCRPCADLGGDFYDAVGLADGRVAFCIADVSGHGAVAAILMASSRALLRASLYETTSEEGPAAVIKRLSHWLGREVLPTEFVTMWLGIYCPKTGLLRTASAAHPPCVIWRHGEHDPEFIPCESTYPLGLSGLEPELAQEHHLWLEPGDRLFLYTDGWIESPSADGTFIEGDALLQLFANSAGQTVDMAPILLFTELERHLADSRIRDDISLLVVDRVE